MKSQWRTVQFFVSARGVHEVFIDENNPKKVMCDCPSYNRFFGCAHTRHVKEHFTDSAYGKTYSISIPEEVDELEVSTAIADLELFREFVIKHGRVLSID